MADPCLRPATELCRALREGEISSRELLERYLERGERLGAGLGALVTLDADRARERADRADAARARGEIRGPLHGLPITVKDCFETEGLRTTCGAGALAEHVPAANAVAVDRLLEAGAVLFGKSNTPAWASDWQTHNELFGTTRNPWNPDRSPGGSSGGSAAAIAAGLTALELGSDIGGSIRIPAHCCGIYGHKPSWGIVPQRGHIPGPPGSLVEKDINVVGPLARSAEDLELALSVLAGPLPDAATAWRLALPPPRRRRLEDYRVAVWADDPDFPVDAQVRERVEAAARAAARAGARVDPEARPLAGLAEAVDLYQRLLAPLMADTLEDAQFGALVQAAARTDPAAGGLGAFTRALGVRHRDWLFLHDARERMRAAWADFFREIDVLLCPASPVPAIPHDASQPLHSRLIQVDGRPRPYTDQFAWTGPIGMAWLPATVAPAGRTPGGLPVGVQVVAPYLEDRTALDFARRLADRIGGFEAPAGFDAPGQSG